MPAVDPSITCPICLDVPDQPVELIPCNSYVCSACLCSSLETSQKISCPCCYSDHLSDYSTIRPITPVISNLIGNTVYYCPSCNKYVTLKDIILHLNSSCKKPESCPLSISTILSVPLSCSSPLTSIERRLTTQLVRWSVIDGVLQVETAGQVHANRFWS